MIAVAYGTQPPALAVAEFAPSARQTAAPPTTESNTAAAGASSRRRATTTTTAPAVSASTTDPAGRDQAPTTVASRSRECYGMPPRQLPDPRSPACLATIFEGDNGGATSTGVTATEIRVAVVGTFDTAQQRGIRAMFDYANRSFELYNRRFVPVFVNTGLLETVPEQRALAVQIGMLDVFAVITPYYTARWFPAFQLEIARQGVVSIMWGAFSPPSEAEVLDALHPYVWSVYPSFEQTWTNAADLICTALAGRPAAHAGGSLATKARKFGVLAVGKYRVPSLRPLRSGLDACGVVPEVAEIPESSGNPVDVAVRTAVERFRADGVTTLLCVCVDNWGIGVLNYVRSAGWTDPEWLTPFLSHTSTLDSDNFVNGLGHEQRSHVFGIQAQPMVTPYQTQGWFQALISSDPDPALLTVSNGNVALPTYETLLVLGSGAQSAGPALTPDTFGQGLMATTFPNSEAGLPPYRMPSVGFGPGDHAFQNDFALAWFSETAPQVNPGSVNQFGSWCYLDQGARFSVGHYPADADSRFFTESPCR